MSHFIANQWVQGEGDGFVSTDPATGQVNWRGNAATAGEIDAAVTSARSALPAWSAAPLDERIGYLKAFAREVSAGKEDWAETISRETGKPLWESRAEVDSMGGKVGLSIEAYRARRAPSSDVAGGVTSAVAYRPHGVVAVLGPFNMPGHLPNGHIVPALLAGNTVVYKPSEQAPLVGQKMIEAWQAAGLPGGVINLVQGAGAVGAALAGHPGIDGLFFTGSAAAGIALARIFASHPGKILALELGGNNPLIVWDVADLRAAAYLTIQSAFITSGQRCSCARRLIIPAGAPGERFLGELLAMMAKIRVGAFTDRPEPFMGPMISAEAARKLLAERARLIDRGAVALESVAGEPPFLRPMLLDVTGVRDRPDVEMFGPLVQVIRVADIDAAIREASNTAYGLAAGILTDDRALWERFSAAARAGVIYWNRATTGASGRLPFGGIGLSGNHRPSGYFAADYCSYPVAVTEDSALRLPEKLLPGIEP